MESLLVEFLRFGRLIGSLVEGKRYILTCDSLPLRQRTMPLDFQDLVELHIKLRYQDDDATRLAALDELCEHVTGLLNVPKLVDARNARGPGLIQVDLVLNAAELSALPFEAARAADGAPLFVGMEPGMVLTRRVRQAFIGHAERWPTRPRVLFAVASPPGVGDPVPFEDHKRALRAALDPWIEPLPGFEEAAPDARKVLTILEGASLEGLSRVCREAVEAKGSKAYTHIHILAHGTAVGDHALTQRFGLALHSEDGEAVRKVTAEELVNALSPAVGTCVAVTLAACDAGSEINPMLRERSIAHQLHESGFPIVVASQMPLTFPGSVILAKEFYRPLLIGKDARESLHRVRTKLHEARDVAGHDWASLVGYVRLPEGYDAKRSEVGLGTLLGSLGTAQCWLDHLVKYGIQNPAAYDRVESALRERIAALQETVENRAGKQRPEVLEENYGLLGSAEKRLAHLFYVCSGRDPSGAPHWENMREALGRARGWYERGYQLNLSSHWNGVQKLSLEAILDGEIQRPGEWHAAMIAAEIDSGKPDDFWAFGSLAELWLLGPLAGQGAAFEKALAALDEMMVRVSQQGAGSFPLDSTRRQLERYVEWWTHDNGFFPGAGDLAEPARDPLGALAT